MEQMDKLSEKNTIKSSVNCTDIGQTDVYSEYMETTKDYTQEGIVNILPIQNLEVTIGNMSLSENFSHTPTKPADIEDQDCYDGKITTGTPTLITEGGSKIMRASVQTNLQSNQHMGSPRFNSENNLPDLNVVSGQNPPLNELTNTRMEAVNNFSEEKIEKPLCPVSIDAPEKQKSLEQTNDFTLNGSKNAPNIVQPSPVTFIPKPNVSMETVERVSLTMNPQSHLNHDQFLLEEMKRRISSSSALSTTLPETVNLTSLQDSISSDPVTKSTVSLKSDMQNTTAYPSLQAGEKSLSERSSSSKLLGEHGSTVQMTTDFNEVKQNHSSKENSINNYINPIELPLSDQTKVSTHRQQDTLVSDLVNKESHQVVYDLELLPKDSRPPMNHNLASASLPDGKMGERFKGIELNELKGNTQSIQGHDKVHLIEISETLGQKAVTNTAAICTDQALSSFDDNTNYQQSRLYQSHTVDLYPTSSSRPVSQGNHQVEEQKPFVRHGTPSEEEAKLEMQEKQKFAALIEEKKKRKVEQMEERKRMLYKDVGINNSSKDGESKAFIRDENTDQIDTILKQIQLATKTSSKSTTREPVSALEETRTRFKIDKLSTDLEDLSKGIVRPDIKRATSESTSRAAAESAMSNYFQRRASMKKNIFQDIDNELKQYKKYGQFGPDPQEEITPNLVEPPLLPENDPLMVDFQQQHQLDSMVESVDSFYTTGKMTLELAMTIVESGAQNIAPNLSSTDVDFIMSNFSFEEMMGQMKKKQEQERTAAASVQNRLRRSSSSSAHPLHMKRSNSSKQHFYF